MARVGPILIGACFIAAASWGLLFANIALYDIGHTQQGLSCREPPQSAYCADLATREGIWNGVIVLAFLALMAGPVLILRGAVERPKPHAGSRPL